MPSEFTIYGVYIPHLLALMFATLPVLLLIRRVLSLIGLYEFVWHRALFDVCLYVVLLQGASLLSRWWLS